MIFRVFFQGIISWKGTLQLGEEGESLSFSWGMPHGWTLPLIKGGGLENTEDGGALWETLILIKLWKRCTYAKIGSSGRDCVLFILFQIYGSRAKLFEGDLFWVDQYESVSTNKAVHCLQTVLYFLKYILRVKVWIFFESNFNISFCQISNLFHSI